MYLIAAIEAEGVRRLFDDTGAPGGIVRQGRSHRPVRRRIRL